MDSHPKRWFFQMAIADICRAIKGKSLMGAFTLSMCAIDAMGYLYHADPKDKVEENFTGWTRKWITDNINNKCNPNVLYALRCGHVHTYGFADKMKKVGVKKHSYVHDQPERHWQMESTGCYTLNLDSLVAEVAVGGFKFFDKSKIDTNRLKMLMKIYQDKPPLSFYSSMDSSLAPPDKMSSTTVNTMVKNNRLAPILNQYKELELGPAHLSGLEMGYIYEELLRRFSEQSGEEAGEHFTPREVIRLMVELLEIPIPDRHVSIYDPACGTGGMLSVAKEHLLDRAATLAQRDNVEKFVTVHGQELSPTNYAICQADLLIKNDRQAKVFLGNSLIPHEAHSKEPGDQLPEPRLRFDFMLRNPPFGVTWGGQDGYEKEARKLEQTRYLAGMP